MSGKWTPGPWVPDFGEVIRIRDMSGATLATVTHTHLSGRRDIVEVEDNARLMAAAAELFDALEMCVSALEVWQLMQPVPSNGLDRFVEKGRAALAKAKGEGA